MTLSILRFAVILPAFSLSLACSNAPSEPSVTDAPQSDARLVIDPPAVLYVGDAPAAIQTHAYLSDGRIADLASAKCVPVWSSSAANVAAVTDGFVRPNSVGDAEIHLECGPLRATATVRVRRWVSGIVKGRDSNLPIAGAVVTIVGSDEPGSEIRTDASGRFMLSAGNEVDAQASAAGFSTSIQHASASQSDLQFLLDQQMLAFIWSGTFQLEEKGTWKKRIPAGSLDGFVFETLNSGRIALTIEAGCNTTGTYDDFGVSLYSRSKLVLGIGASFYGGSIQRQTATAILPADTYTLRLSDSNFYASVGCAWHLELTRPR
jgi:hypothetical protein